MDSLDQKAGDEIKCGMQSTFTKISTSPLDPRCLVYSQKNTNYLIIRVENFNQFTSNNQFSLAFDNIYI